MSELKVIYLGPACQEQGDGREWCQDDVWEKCDCGHESVPYVIGTELDRVSAERDALQLRLNAADQRIDELTVPTGYCLMPTRLTAENGAKALLLGEFKLEVTTECPECRELEEPLEGCEVCDGEGEYGQQHMIPWDQIKFIYSEAVKGLAKKTNIPQ
ncbi:hypothetical protein ACOI7N_13805 [Pseudomonas sp. P2758]|uniref:hypothetical protein n=1 Tax=Pseudomonas sp. P2758 TaxID=3409916 RepID=UPI003B59008C